MTLFLQRVPESIRHHGCTLTWVLWLTMAIPGHTDSNLPDLETAAEDHQAGRGWMLMHEQGCFQCHSPPQGTFKGIPPFDAPVLDDVALRLKPGFVRSFILNPDKEHPDTRMPALLGDMPTSKAEEVASLLTDYLWHLSSGKTNASNHTSSGGSIHRGRSLFKRIGCAACHSPLEEGGSQNKSLHHVAQKYQSRGLHAFLMQPSKVRRGFRMPDFHLTSQEASDLTSYLMQDGIPTETVHISEADAIRRGRQWFADLQCTACHTLEAEEKKLRVALPLPLPTQASEGCLAKTPQRGMPWYELSSKETLAIEEGLLQAKQSPATIWKPGTKDYMYLMQCHACHARGNLSGPDQVHQTYFTSSGRDLEDEGRLPPSLDGVGRKLTPQALEATLRGALPVRPYMHTRMPDWGPSHARVISKALGRLDHEPQENPTPREGSENQVGRNMWGRALVGMNGLGCIQCHVLNGNPSLGIQAMDLKHAPERLRAAWFRDYLLDPARFRPGTRMPAFWPDGKPSISGHGGSTARQIDSLWVYLNELDQSRLPEGLETAKSFRLSPEERPLVFRTFMEEAGLHAIAVGFPTSYHAAFDAQACRWILSWKGAFLDAEATWDDRFTPLTPPGGQPLHWFPSPGQHWYRTPQENPDQTLPLASRFSGYHLDNDGNPTFLYSVGNMQVKDRITSSETGLTRRLSFPSSARDIHCLVGHADHIDPDGQNGFKVHPDILIQVHRGQAVIKKSSQGVQLWLTPSPQESEPLLEYIMSTWTP